MLKFELEVVKFETKDVITTSGTPSGPSTCACPAFGTFDLSQAIG